MKNGFDVKFRLNYVISGLILITIGGILIFYVWFYLNDISFKLIDVMAYATGSVAIMTLIYHSLRLSSSYNFHKENLKIRKNQYSFEVIAKFHDPLMSDTIKALRKIKDEKSSLLEEKNIKEFLEYLDAKPNIHTKMTQLFNYFEHISLLVENRHVDENIIKAAFKTLFISIYSEYKFYIDERQTKHRRAWIKFEELCKKWSSE